MLKEERGSKWAESEAFYAYQTRRLVGDSVDVAAEMHSGCGSHGAFCLSSMIARGLSGVAVSNSMRRTDDCCRYGGETTRTTR